MYNKRWLLSRARTALLAVKRRQQDDLIAEVWDARYQKPTPKSWTIICTKGDEMLGVNRADGETCVSSVTQYWKTSR